MLFESGRQIQRLECHARTCILHCALRQGRGYSSENPTLAWATLRSAGTWIDIPSFAMRKRRLKGEITTFNAGAKRFPTSMEVWGTLICSCQQGLLKSEGTRINTYQEELELRHRRYKALVLQSSSLYRGEVSLPTSQDSEYEITGLEFQVGNTAPPKAVSFLTKAYNISFPKLVPALTFFLGYYGRLILHL